MEGQDMIGMMISSVLLSLLHALILNHWLPILAMGRSENWSISKTTRITFISGTAHVISTVLIGVFIGQFGKQLSKSIDGFTHFIAPLLLIGLGIYFIYRHHHHFHLSTSNTPRKSEKKIIIALVVAMFFSPCMEIEGLFLMAGAHGWSNVMVLATLYAVITIIGMIICVRLAYLNIFQLNWHVLEHNAGLITGGTLIVTGVVSYFIQ